MSKLVRILLPEIQVIDYIKENGIINKDHFKKDKKAIVNTTSNIKHKVSNMASLNSSNKIDKSVDSIKNVTTNVKSKNSTIDANIGKINKMNKQEIDIAFEKVESTLSDYVLGQAEYLSNLIMTFKRPFLYGKKDGIKNTIFITGPKGSGRHLSVKAITRFLKEEKLIKSSGVYSVDLSKYKLEKDAENLFLPDLYNALYGSEKVIVFDNFDKCHQNALDLLNKLVVDEKLKLNRRYMDQLGQMVDVTGKGNLTLNTTDEILANSKYMVFITEKNEESIRSTFTNDFMKKVNDIISTRELDEKDLSIVCKFILGEYKEKIRSNLNISIDFDESVLRNILKNFDKYIGAHGLEEYVKNYIYSPLVEAELTTSLDKEYTYELIELNDRLTLKSQLTSVDLSSLVKQIKSENVDELNEELKNIVGLSSVKEFITKLQDNIKIQNIRKQQGSKEAKLSLHMIFTGNPGAGKTTMARIMAKYLKALGYLSSGHLVEVSRNDLVGQYVGETAQKTMNKINSAMGGVLVIDEAYAIARDENDIFGIEAVDTIVKAVEDNRDNLVVILAGYTQEMQDFLKTNSGLKSRFNYNVEFEDYTPSELLEITKIIAKSNGYIIDSSIDKNLLELFESKQIKGKSDSGNGRLARNIVEQAVTNQSNRLAKLDENDIQKDELNKLTISDFGLDTKEVFDLEEELTSIIGLDDVKEFVRDLEKQLIAKEKRKQIGVSVESSQSLNMIFTGNPGTGKTTVARLIGNLMKRMGVLKSGQVVETDRSGLVGQYAGETTKKTTEIFKSALGGVLFIDEAYALMSSENDPLGKEAVDTLVKLIEDF
jgi:SpoVK/Ycf46/Vps4 family AAA+-type ATPase